MAIMSTLRDKTHIVLFVLLAAFLALIVFEWGMQFTGPGRKGAEAGSVNGKVIPMARYEEVHKGLSENFRHGNPGAEITPQAEAGFREQAWNIVVDQVLVEDVFEKFGIRVQEQEVLNAVNSQVNPPMVIRQNFTDPRTGQIDRALLDKARRAPENKEFWVNAEQVIKRELMVDKLLLALKTMVPVTGQETADIVQRQFTRFSASFIPVPLSSAGPDKLFPVKESDIKTWYESHKEEFKQEPTRGADFVFFPLVPSSKDSMQVKKEIDALLPQFVSAKSDSEFVKVQSDRPNAVNVTYSRADFSPQAGAMVFGSPKLVPGQVIGPVADRGMYRLLKIRSVSSGAPIASASHILIRFNPADHADMQQAVVQVTDLLAQLKSGASFAELAAKYSQDPGSAKNGGSVGWFTKERMVPEFAQAVFSGRPGQIVGPVRTQFGLHIIKIDGLDQKQVTCSEVVREIKSSSETVESIRRKAMVFQQEAKGKGFEAGARLEKLDIGKTGEFSRRSQIPSIGFSDRVNQFAFRAKEGDVSDVLETDRGFYVMRLTSRNDTGYRVLDGDFRKMIEMELVMEKKGAALKAKLQALAKGAGGSLEAVLGRDSTLKKVTSNEIRWADGYIDGYGVDRQLVEAMSGMKLNTLSAPVKTSNGYALVLLTGKRMQEGVDVAAEEARILPQYRRLKQEQLFAEYFNAVRKSAKIVDNRP